MKKIFLSLISYGAVFLTGSLFASSVFWSPIPYEWSQRITEFFLIKTPLPEPFAPASSCPDYRAVVGTMTRMWPNRSYGQAEFYAATDPEFPEPSILETGVPVDEEGVITWRYQTNEPYIAFPLAGNWTMYFPDNKEDATSVQAVAESIAEFRRRMEQAGFVFSQANDIPLYRYPQGNYSRKLGFTKGEYLYQVILGEELPWESVSDPEVAARTYISMNCAQDAPELRRLYASYLRLPHAFTNETSIFFIGASEQVARFSLLYPGSTWDHLSLEYYRQKESGEMEFLLQTDNFPACAVFERQKIGKDTSCYRPEKREFDVVTY